MDALRMALGIALALARCFAAQQLGLMPGNAVAVAEAEYRDAMDAWVRGDPNLERDLFHEAPEKMRPRIQKAAALRDHVMVRKEAYLDVLIPSMRETRNRLPKSDANSLPVEALRKDLASQQARILTQQENTESQLRDLAQSTEYLLVRKELEEERTLLIGLQNGIAMRIRSLDLVDKAQEAIKRAPAADVLARALDEILKVWEQERASTTRQRGLWANVYATMEREIGPKGTKGKTGSARPTEAPVEKGPKKRGGGKPGPAAVDRSSARPARLVGSWIYQSQPNAWTGHGEPERVALDLRDREGQITGTYRARLPVRGGIHEVQLSLAGPRESAGATRLHWKSQTPPAEGEIDVKVRIDGHLLLERSISSDSYIPLGMEVLVPSSTPPPLSSS